MKGRFIRCKFYCPHCDKSMVAGGGKCPVCGKRVYGRKLRKHFKINKLDLTTDNNGKSII